MKFIFILLSLLFVSSCDSEKPTDTDATSSSENANSGELLIYSGRKPVYADPLFKMFTEKTGIKILTKEGKTTELANLIIKEGEYSKADLFFAQDSSNLGALSAKGLLEKLPETITSKVDTTYKSKKGEWIGTSGRARVLVYNKNKIKPEELPKSIYELTDAKWKGKLGWALKNGSFQSHVTAMIQVDGYDKTVQWLKDMKANDTQNYAKNTPIVKAVAKGEVYAGLVNHYYLYKVRKDMAEAVDAENHFFADGDTGMFVNISGIALMKNSKNKDNAKKFIEFLLSKEAQEFFKEENFEYPLTSGVEAFKELKPLSSFKPVEASLEDLDNIEKTKKALEEAGCL